MTKMEALKEVNNMLTEVLDEIETEMFINDIIVEDDQTNDSPNILFENKMVE